MLETYLKYKDEYLAPPYYTEEGFAAMQNLIPAHQEFIRRAARIPGLKIVYGTDAVAGAHGRNAEDFIHRVNECGIDPMAAMVSANFLAAEALGMANKIGSIAPGLQADIIALDGNPLTNIDAVRQVVFVMKSGVVYKNWRSTSMATVPSAGVVASRTASSTETATRANSSPPTALRTVPLISAAWSIAPYKTMKATRRTNMPFPGAGELNREAKYSVLLELER